MCPCPPPKNGNGCSCDDLFMLSSDANWQIESFVLLNNYVKVKTETVNNQITSLTFRPNDDYYYVRNELYAEHVKINFVGNTQDFILPLYVKHDGDKLHVIGPNL